MRLKSVEQLNIAMINVNNYDNKCNKQKITTTDTIS
jgi:hypothetical protein